MVANGENLLSGLGGLKVNIHVGLISLKIVLEIFLGECCKILVQFY